MTVKKTRRFKYKRLGEKTIPTLARLRPHQNLMLKKMATSEKASEAEIIRSAIEVRHNFIYTSIL